MVRRVDDLGRVVIPKETRTALGLATGTPMEIFINGNEVILKPYLPGCTFCGAIENDRDVVRYQGKFVCSKCLVTLQGFPAPSRLPADTRDAGC